MFVVWLLNRNACKCEFCMSGVTGIGLGKRGWRSLAERTNHSVLGLQSWQDMVHAFGPLVRGNRAGRQHLTFQGSF